MNHLVPSYHSNLANELRKSRKTCLYDLGVRNSILRDFRATGDRDDRGAIHESYVYLTLRALLRPNMELRFWRTKRGEEVHFVLVKDRMPHPIEVKSSCDDDLPPLGIQAFRRRYPKTPHTFTVSGTPREARLDGDRTDVFLEFEEVPRILETIA